VAVQIQVHFHATARTRNKIRKIPSAVRTDNVKNGENGGGSEKGSGAK